MLYGACLACILLICVDAEHTVRCNNDTNPISRNFVSLEPSPDGVPGRYEMVWCTRTVADVTTWQFRMYYNTSRKPDQCKTYNVWDRKIGSPHSAFDENINIDLNCSHVCFSRRIDLIFEACYHIKNALCVNEVNRESHDQLIYVTNNFTNITSLNKIKPASKVFCDKEYTTVLWFLGPVPAAHFTMLLDNITAPEGAAAGAAAWDVTAQCAPTSASTLRCRLRAPPASYRLLLLRPEPWTYGRLAAHNVQAVVECSGSEAEAAARAAGAWGAAGWGAVAACAALALAVPAAVVLRRARRSPPRAKPAAEGAGAAAGAAGAEAGGVRVRVLLLYARDCPALLAAARRLAALLQHVAPDGVYDLYEPAVSAQAARAPAEWLRAVLERADVRVVLLQTPAADCLYTAQLRERGSSLPLERPLLRARAAPHCAEPLLQLALRLMCEAPHHLTYRKFYIAEMAGLEADVVPLVTPQRRYVLPGAAALLLRDLAPGAPAAPPELVAHLERAAQELQQFVRDKPDYLEDELVFL